MISDKDWDRAHNILQMSPEDFHMYKERLDYSGEDLIAMTNYCFDLLGIEREKNTELVDLMAELKDREAEIAELEAKARVLEKYNGRI